MNKYYEAIKQWRAFSALDPQEQASSVLTEDTLQDIVENIIKHSKPSEPLPIGQTVVEIEWMGQYKQGELLRVVEHDDDGNVLVTDGHTQSWDDVTNFKLADTLPVVIPLTLIDADRKRIAVNELIIKYGGKPVAPELGAYEVPMGTDTAQFHRDLALALEVDLATIHRWVGH